MQIPGKNCIPATSLAILFIICICTTDTSASPKRSKLYRDISAIGHRNIGGDKGLGNFYSFNKEQELGTELSFDFEKEDLLLSDSATTDYIQRIAQNIAQNSDAQMPVTVRVVNDEKSYAVVLPGGYQYISRGLLLQLQSEGEVASIVSRGVSHTALRSITRERTRIQYANIGGIPLEDPDRLMSLSTADDSYIPFGFLTFRRGYEFEADYFGVQYLYKAGYDPACFIQAVQSIWTPHSGTKSNALSPFPPLKDRIKYLQKEISEILPARDQAIISRPDFIEFQKHLRDLPPAKSDQPVFKVPPTLMRSQPISPYSSLSK